MFHLPGYSRIDNDNLDEDDRQGCFFLIIGAIVVSVSAFLAYREVIYLCFGRQTAATVERVFDVRGRHANTTVIFNFTDAGTEEQRRESDQLRLGWRPLPGPLPVEYVSGSASFVRVAGHRQRWSLWVFGASLTAAILYIGKLVREANRPIRRKRRY